MKTNLLILSFLFVVFLSFTSCSSTNISNDNSESKTSIEESVIVKIDSISVDTTVEEDIELEYSTLHTGISDFLSGKSKSYFDTILSINEDFWTEFSDDINKDYSKIESRRLSKMSQWVDTSFIDKSIDTSLVFYPFSGPDFLHANFLYPNANEYILMALEDVGSIPNWKNFGPKKTENYLENVNRFLRDIYLRSYFITKHMKLDIKKEEKISGVISSLYWFLGKTGHKIIDVKYVSINPEGKIVDYTGVKDPKAIQFRFFRQGEFKTKKLTYLSCDISDKGLLTKNPEIYTFLNNMRWCNTFVKSASYLMHYKSFKMIREIVTKKSITLFQDDTGIPYKYMKDKDFSFQCFGKYVKPIKDFEHKNDILYQKDLELLYKKGSVKLPFSLGYHWRDANEQNQMLIENLNRIENIKEIEKEKKNIVEENKDQVDIKNQHPQDSYVVIGSFRNSKKAHSYSRKINKDGYSFHVLFDNNKRINLVVLGPFSEEDSKIELLNVKKKIEKNAWIFRSSSEL